MLTEGMIIGMTAISVALINILPQFKLRSDIKEILTKVDKLEKYVISNENIVIFKKKFSDIQSYYLNKIDEKYKCVAIMKSDTFIELVVDFGLGLNMEDINHYTAFQDHLLSASRYNKRRMLDMLGEKITKEYYETHGPNMLRYNTIVKKIFFTTVNNKKTQFISASIDFMQIFMEKFVSLSNDNKSMELLSENELQIRRIKDHI